MDDIWKEIASTPVTKRILLIDMRVIDDPIASSHDIRSFINKFNKDFKVEIISTSGSIIPENIATLIATDTKIHVTRNEFTMWKSLTNHSECSEFVYGDYGVVSPNYSDLDLDPSLMNGVSTPKAFYAYQDQFYVCRGRRFKTHGYDQYFDIADDITGQSFFRGLGYSYGDGYIYDRRRSSTTKPAKGGSPGSWIKSLTNAHITFIIKTI